MPMSRYEIRNEYSLADPELYRAADKDDPEALLEGVSMAGLVGVLRQLGDLAEFAAEIFHDLHEEVMATAARGHGLVIRVQQLESEVPFIEKAFLSQTDHTPFFYNAGVDWHSNLRMDQNLVTQGDLPRFVMDSYEECRGPPRLFLLDKFDVAGAGACLKRFTDPSFFKVETSGMARADVLREKTRKAKKKGPRWRNGGTPEVLPTSHAKLHQLFMEERAGNGIGNPARRVKLKRRLNGFPFDSVSGRGYMEKLLKTPSPDHKVHHDNTVSSSPSMLPTDDCNESTLEVPEEVKTVDPDTEGVGRNRSVSPPGREEIMLNLSIYEPNKTSKDDEICEAQNSYHGMVTDKSASTFEKLAGEKNIVLDGDCKGEANLTDYQSDEIASEMDNYVDAPSTMDSDMDTDSELKVKSDLTFNFIRTQPLISHTDEEDNHTRSSDSQSTGESIISDEGNNSSKRETSSFSSSNSPSTSAENPHSETKLGKGFASADIPEIDIVDAPDHQRITDVELHVEQHPKLLVPDHTCTSTDAITNQRPDFEQLPSSLGITDVQPTLALSNSGVMEKDKTWRTELKELASASDDEEKKINMFTDPPSAPCIAGEDGSQRSSSEEQHAGPDGENMPFINCAAGNLCPATSSTPVSSDLLHEDGCESEDLTPLENIASTLNTSNVLPCNRNNTPEMIPLENPLQYNIDDKVQESPEIIFSDCPDIVHTRENITSTFSKGEKQPEDMVNKETSISTDATSCFSYIMEDSYGKELAAATFSSAHFVDAEEDCSNRSSSTQISSELILPHVVKSLCLPGTVLDGHGRNVFPEEETTVNGTPALGILESSEVVGLQGPGVACELNSNDPAALESSCGSPENLEEPAGPSDCTENDEITTYTSSVRVDVGSSDLKLLNEVHVPLNDSDPDQLETSDIASATPAVSDDADGGDVCSPVSPAKWVAEHTPYSEDAGMGELGDNRNCLSVGHKKSSSVEEVSQIGATTSDLNGVLGNTIFVDHLNSEVSDIVPDSGLHSDADHSLELVDSIAIQPATEQSGLDAEEETPLKSGFTNLVSDDPSLSIVVNTREITFLEEIELPPNQLDEELLDSCQINSGVSNLLPVNRQEMPDHENHERNNNSALMFSVFNHAGPPSLSVLPGLCDNKSEFFECTKDPIGPIFLPSNHFPETNQVSLDELPPLPPLPPVQWRTGKLQHASITEEDTMNQKLLPRINSTPIASTDTVSPLLEETNHSLVQFFLETALKEEKADPSQSNLAANAIYETTGLQQEIGNKPRQPSTSFDDGSPLEEMNHSLIQIDHESAPKAGEHSSSCLEACAKNETIDLPPKVENKLQQPTSPNADVNSLEEKNYSLVQINPETASEGENIEQSSSSLEASPMPETVDLPPKVENEQRKPVLSFSASELTPPAEEGVSNESCRVKLPRPRNPLIDAVAAIDKSRLRKVTERVRPEIQKLDERDSLLEQIRTKSFNLKPAVASRPSIRGPNTNLKVAAILEKANAIRQAFAGSDEDDEDSWSDS